MEGGSGGKGGEWKGGEGRGEKGRERKGNEVIDRVDRERDKAGRRGGKVEELEKVESNAWQSSKKISPITSKEELRNEISIHYLKNW